MNDIEWKLVDRFKEPSSWAALATPLAALGIAVPGGLMQGISLLGAGLCVLLGVLLKEAPKLVALFLAATIAVALSACGGVKDLADPATAQKDIVEACTASGLFKAAGGAASAAFPVAALPVAVVNAGVDHVCGNPATFAGDASTAYWVVKNTLAFVKAKAGA